MELKRYISPKMCHDYDIELCEFTIWTRKKSIKFEFVEMCSKF